MMVTIKVITIFFLYFTANYEIILQPKEKTHKKINNKFLKYNFAVDRHECIMLFVCLVDCVYF